MNLVDLFLSTDGRVWIGTLILAAISTAAMMLNLAVVGVSQTAVLISVLVAFALAYPSYALMAKRFQDRDRPGMLALLGIVPVFIVNLLYTFRILDPIEPTALSRFLDVILVVIGFWLLVELGCLKGTQGPNRYGPDPLGQSQTDANLG
ncbi:MAG: DUF805 domain-containing protein [Methyloceanibacter sp.]|uniref:DUF805 domain-containing protein n=1 Tax=Methyloceanibacter sp. TaxID=1965321 RepID=UPI003D9BC78C